MLCDIHKSGVNVDDTADYVGIHEGLVDDVGDSYSVGDFAHNAAAETFYVLTESGFIINTENNYRIIKESAPSGSFYLLAENGSILDLENSDKIRVE